MTPDGEFGVTVDSRRDTELEERALTLTDPSLQ